MISKESDFFAPASPRLVFDESMFDPDIPYRVAGNMQAFGEFLRQHGMHDQNIKDLSVIVQRRASIGSRFLGSEIGCRGFYDVRSRVITIATDWAWKELVYANSFGDYPELELNDAILHEGKHALDYKDRESSSSVMHVVKQSVFPIGGWSSGVGIWYGLSTGNAPLPVYGLALVPVIAGYAVPLIHKWKESKKWRQKEDDAVEFQEIHHRHPRWESMVSLTPIDSV